MKRAGVILVLGLCLVWLSTPVSAQETPELASLEIGLWPEFDRPGILVIYQGVFAPDTPLPLPVEIRLPARVGQPTAVAFVDEGGGRFNQVFSTRVEEDTLVVSFELATPAFQLEYYDTLPQDAAGWREYTLTYTADYPIVALSLEAQVPPAAQEFALDPPASSVAPQADGLVYHRAEAGPVARGEMRSWTIRYQKANADLTIPPASAAGQEPAPEVRGGDNSAVLIFVVAFVALIAVGAAAFWLGRSTGPAGEGVGRQAHTPGRGRPTFCRRCGAELRPDSEFCHKCGTAVRDE